jgi:hypothetical protein
MQHPEPGWKRLILLLLHWAIIVNFLVEMAYSSYIIFYVIAPSDSGPLFERVLTMPHEDMVTRRLYATEFWIATAGLSIYLALTEFLPRKIATILNRMATTQTNTA